MKSNNLFRDQVNHVTNLFENWSECEQTVALCSLFKQVSPTQCRFLAQVLHQTDCSEVVEAENEANNPAYVCKLASESKQIAITKLLTHLPLLRAENHQAKSQYLKLITSVLDFTIQNGQYIEESRQIISYSYIHPAITDEERSDFTMWIGKLEEQFTYSIGPGCHQKPTLSQQYHEKPSSPYHKPLIGNGQVNGHNWPTPQPNTDSSLVNKLEQLSINTENVLTSPSQNPASQCHPSAPNIIQGDVDPHINASTVLNHTAIKVPLHATVSAPVPSQNSNGSSRGHNPLRRTPSVVPPGSISLSSNINDWLQQSEEQIVDNRGRSQSMPSEHAPLSPQSSITSSGSSSDTHQDDGPQPVRNSFMEESSGMRDVPLWLKSLRLHKYSYIFQQITYEEMLSINEEFLESQGVTKGARTKILLSVQKLKERQDALRALEKDIMDGGSTKAALAEMKNMINTPMKSYSVPTTQSTPTSPADGDIAEGDVPAQFTRLMGKVCTQLLVASRPDDECFNLYLSLIDKCINHEAFTYRQKKLLATWKQETQKIYHPPHYKYSIGKPKAGWGNTFPLGASVRASFGPKPVKSTTQWSFGGKRSIVGGTTSGQMPLQRNSSLNPAIFSKPGFPEGGKQQVTRTHSAPLRSANLGLAVSDGSDQSSSDNAENYAQLDSLCLSVTEHALGGPDPTYKGSTF